MTDCHDIAAWVCRLAIKPPSHGPPRRDSAATGGLVLGGRAHRTVWVGPDAPHDGQVGRLIDRTTRRLRIADLTI